MDHTTEKGRKGMGKHPFGRLAPKWKRDATTDPDKIREWLEEVPDLNFGLVTGRPHTVVLDGREHELFLMVIDADSAQAVHRLHVDMDMPNTLDVLTGRGLHLYYWTPMPVRGANRLLRRSGIFDVDVRGVNGYVMAPGSRHYSGAIYRPQEMLDDIAAVTDDLMGYLVPYVEGRQGTSKHYGNVISIDEARAKTLPKLDLDQLPADLVIMLHEDPQIEGRSEPEFACILRLLDVTDDDDLILGTVRAYPIGQRLLERDFAWGYGEIERARDWKAQTPEQQREHFVENQKALAEEQWDQACLSLTTMERKVLRGFQDISIQRGGGKFPAPVAEVAIAAGVTNRTVLRHRTTLLKTGWLQPVHLAAPGEGYASTYLLAIPSADSLRGGHLCTTPHIYGGGVRVSASGGAEGALRGRTRRSRNGEKSPSQKSPPQKSPPLVDLSEDSARWNTTHSLWAVLSYVTEEVTPTQLAKAMGKSARQVRRNTAQLLELGLIEDRLHIKLVPDWESVWDAPPEKKGTAGMKQAAVKRLEEQRLLRRGEAVRREDGHVVMVDTGEII
jgi:hypothetical protein